MAIVCDFQNQFFDGALALLQRILPFQDGFRWDFIFDFTAVLEVSCWHQMTLFTSDFEASNYAVFRTSRSKLTCRRIVLQITENFGILAPFLETMYGDGWIFGNAEDLLFKKNRSQQSNSFVVEFIVLCVGNDGQMCIDANQVAYKRM